MKLAKKIVIGTLAAIALVTAWILVAPQPQAVNDTFLFKLQLALSTALTLMYIGSAIMFLASLRTYKAQMRHAFITLAVGILFVAVATVQLPILDAYGLTSSFWASSGLIVVPFLLGGVITYVGMRAFARLVGTHTVLTRASVVLAGATVLSVLSAFLPHPIPSSSEIELDISNGIILWIGVFDFASMLVVLQVKQRIGAHYVNAMAWLFAAFVGSVMVAIAAFLDSLLTAKGSTLDFASILTNVITLAVGALYLRAGYAFTQTEDY